jgi:hypothetical protein
MNEIAEAKDCDGGGERVKERNKVSKHGKKERMMIEPRQEKEDV